MIRLTRTELSTITSRGESGGGPLISDSSARGAGGGRNAELLLEKMIAQRFGALGESRGEDLGDHAAH